MHRLKSLLFYSGSAALLFFTLTMTSCPYYTNPTYLRHDRVKHLMFDLSSSAANRHIVDNFHSAMTNRSTYISESFWNGTAFDESHRPFESDYSGTETERSGGVFRLTTWFNSEYDFPPGSWTNHLDIVFDVKEDGPGNWMITYLSTPGITCGTPAP